MIQHGASVVSRLVLVLLFGAALVPACAHWLPSTASRVLDERGGLVTTADGEIRLHVPPGALSGPQRITLERLDVAPGSVDDHGWDVLAAVEIRPDGLALQQPAWLEISGAIPADVLAQGVVGLPMILDVDGNAPERTASAQDLVEGRTTASAALSHFSRYEQRYLRGVLTFSLETPAWMPVGQPFDASARVVKDPKYQLEVRKVRVSLEATEATTGRARDEEGSIPRQGAQPIAARAHVRCREVGFGWVRASFHLEGQIAWALPPEHRRLQDHQAEVKDVTLCHRPIATRAHAGGIAGDDVLEAKPPWHALHVNETGDVVLTVRVPAGADPAGQHFLDAFLFVVRGRDVLSEPMNADGSPLFDPDFFSPPPPTHWWTRPVPFANGEASTTVRFRCRRRGLALPTFRWQNLDVSTLFTCSDPEEAGGEGSDEGEGSEEGD